MWEQVIKVYGQRININKNYVLKHMIWSTMFVTLYMVPIATQLEVEVYIYVYGTIFCLQKLQNLSSEKRKKNGLNKYFALK